MIWDDIQHLPTVLQLAQQMIIEIQTAGLPFAHLVFDSWDNARWLTQVAHREVRNY